MVRKTNTVDEDDVMDLEDKVAHLTMAFLRQCVKLSGHIYHLQTYINDNHPHA